MMQHNYSLRQHLPKKTLGEASTNTSISSTMDLDYRRINPEYWIKTYRKDVCTFKVYFDGFDEKSTDSLRRKIILLGGSNEVFFGQQCTHMVTAKAFYDELPTKDYSNALTFKDTNQENQENKPSQVNRKDSKAALPKKPCVAKDPSHQAFFDRAHMWGIEIWSISKMNCVISALFHKPTINGSATSRASRLDKMLMEEKRYGVSTGQRNGQAPRPTFVTFDDQYVMVEDVTGVHRPILVKEYTMPTFDPAIPENDRVYPWPKLYVKEDAHSRSPFVLPDPKQQPSKKTGPQQSPKAHTPPQQIPLQPNHAFATPLTTSLNQNNNIDINATQTTTGIPLNKLMYDSIKPQHPIITHLEKENIDPKLHQDHPPTTYHDTIGLAFLDVSHNSSRASYSNNTNTTSVFPSSTVANTSNFSQPSKSTNTPLTNSTVLNTSDKSSMTFRRSGRPLSENVSRLGRRMVSNQRISESTEPALTKKSPGKDNAQSKGLRSAVLVKTAHDQAERRKKDLARRTAREHSKYCENCGVCYQDLEKHQQDESHQAFVRDKNNFKELDLVLESTQRTRL